MGVRRRAIIPITLGALVAVAVVIAISIPHSSATITAGGVGDGTPSLPNGITLRQIDGGTSYFREKNKNSAWMDEHILLGGWLEQPVSAENVKEDIAMGNNIYWDLGGDPLDTKDCNGAPCRVNFDTIRANGMHASAPDVTSQSGSETVAFSGVDEADLDFGPGWNGWNPKGPYDPNSCIPSGSYCGFTVAKFYYTGAPASYGSTGYPVGQRIVTQGFGKGVLFFDSTAQAEQFLQFSDVLSADSYWMSDPSLDATSGGGCALFPANSPECANGTGPGLTTAQRALPANYAYNVTRLEQLSNQAKPVVVDVETGCPDYDGVCTTPSAMTAAAWHALIAGARGIIWFQHNLSGPCADFRTFYDGSDPTSSMYNCQQSPGVTPHNVVQSVSAFNHEVASLNSVLLSPFAVNYVDVGDADVSVMAKYTKTGFYVFAGSGKPATPPGQNQAVTFKVADGYTGPVTVVDENRTVQADNGVFTDTFANADSVHIYKIP